MFHYFLLTISLLANALGANGVAQKVEAPLLPKTPTISQTVSSNPVTQLPSLAPIPKLQPNTVFDVRAESALIYDVKTGTVLYEKSGHQIRPMVSTVKIISGLLIVEKGGLDQTVTVSKNAAAQGGSRMNLVSGDELSRKNLLLGMFLNSGNDAAVALAEATYGTTENFVAAMNQKASSLGLRESHFADAAGYNEDQTTSSCYDISKALSVASKNQALQDIMTTKDFDATDVSGKRVFKLSNSNRLVQDGFMHLIGGKTGTGTFGKGGHVLVSEVQGVDASGHTQTLVGCVAGTYVNSHTASSDELKKLFSSVFSHLES